MLVRRSLGSYGAVVSHPARPEAPDSQFGKGQYSLLSPAYKWQPSKSCFWLLMQVTRWAVALALDNAGSSMLARMAMMAMTTNSSINVKAFGEPFCLCWAFINQNKRIVHCNSSASVLQVNSTPLAVKRKCWRETFSTGIRSVKAG